MLSKIIHLLRPGLDNVGDSVKKAICLKLKIMLILTKCVGKRREFKSNLLRDTIQSVIIFVYQCFSNLNKYHNRENGNEHSVLGVSTFL